MPGRPDTLSIVVTITSSPSQSVVFPKLNLVLRNPSFMRNGYLEEIYNLKKS